MSQSRLPQQQVRTRQNAGGASGTITPQNINSFTPPSRQAQSDSQYNQQIIIPPSDFNPASQQDINTINLSIEQLSRRLKQASDSITNLKLIEISSAYQQAHKEMNKAKEELIHLIQQYFSEINANLKAGFTLIPSEELRQDTRQRIQDIVKEFDGNSSKLLANTLSQKDVQMFTNKQYQTKVEAIEEDVVFLTKPKNDDQPQSFPYFKICYQQQEQLLLKLNEYIHMECPFPNLTQQSLNNLQITTQNLSENEPNFKNKQTFVIQSDYKLQVIDRRSNTMESDQEWLPAKDIILPVNLQTYQQTQLYIDNQTRLFSGGVYLSNSCISGLAYTVDLTNNAITKLPDMKVKRIGHALVSANGRITSNADNNSKKVDNNNDSLEKSICYYAIGGRVDSSTCTRLCERYDTKKKQWEVIASLNQARSRSACCVFNKSSIYAFYGTNSETKSVETIEKYDIQNNKWEVIEVINQLPGYDVSFAMAQQINDTQILLLGGFRETMMSTSGQLLFSRKLVAFNVQNNTLTLFSNMVLPVDFIPLSQPIMQKNHSLIVAGMQMAGIGDKPVMNLDAVVIIEVVSSEKDGNSGSVVVNKIIDLEGKDNSQKSS